MALADQHLPLVTINVAVLNEELRLRPLLESIVNQTYPRDRIEVLVVDGGSTDGTLKIAEEFGCQVVPNPRRESDIGRRIGCEAATGELHVYLDADMELAARDALEQLVRPFLDRDDIVGTFTRFVVDRSDPPLNRCLSYHPLQQDPLMRYLSTQIADTIVRRSPQGYDLCEFRAGKAPVLGVVLFRTEMLRDFLNHWGVSWRWSDVDFVVECAARGMGPFAYVSKAGIYHRSYHSPKIYLKKKKRDVRWSYLDTVGKRQASYLSWQDPRDVGRLVLWVLYVNTVLPPLVVAAFKAIKHRDSALLYEAFLATVGTDYVLLQFVVDPRGRSLIRRALSSLLIRRSQSAIPKEPVS